MENKIDTSDRLTLFFPITMGGIVNGKSIVGWHLQDNVGYSYGSKRCYPITVKFSDGTEIYAFGVGIPSSADPVRANLR